MVVALGFHEETTTICHTIWTRSGLRSRFVHTFIDSVARMLAICSPNIHLAFSKASVTRSCVLSIRSVLWSIFPRKQQLGRSPRFNPLNLCITSVVESVSTSGRKASASFGRFLLMSNKNPGICKTNVNLLKLISQVAVGRADLLAASCTTSNTAAGDGSPCRFGASASGTWSSCRCCQEVHLMMILPPLPL